jgi:hypothetical protein
VTQLESSILDPARIYEACLKIGPTKQGVGVQSRFEQNRAKAGSRGAVAPAPRALPSAQGDVEGCVGARAIACPVRAITLTLESGRALPPALSPIAGAGGR